MGLPTDTSSPGPGWAEILSFVWCPACVETCWGHTMFGGLYGLEQAETTVQKSKLHTDPKFYTKVPEQKEKKQSSPAQPHHREGSCS